MNAEIVIVPMLCITKEFTDRESGNCIPYSQVWSTNEEKNDVKVFKLKNELVPELSKYYGSPVRVSLNLQYNKIYSIIG